MDHVDAVVIGAGVVGLAAARALALSPRFQGAQVLVLEAADAIGTGTSSRNSEVIHAGIYYPQGSLKARLCVQGRQQLYAYCAERAVAHRRCGKLIVATDQAQIAQLELIAAKARANGVDDMHFLTAEEAQTLEPALQCTAAVRLGHAHVLGGTVAADGARRQRARRDGLRHHLEAALDLQQRGGESTQQRRVETQI